MCKNGALKHPNLILCVSSLISQATPNRMEDKRRIILIKLEGQPNNNSTQDEMLITIVFQRLMFAQGTFQDQVLNHLKCNTKHFIIGL